MDTVRFFGKLSEKADALAFRADELAGVERLLSRLEPLAGARVVDQAD